MDMTAVVAVFLAAAVITTWLAAIAYFRLRTPFQRIHVVTLLNIVAGLGVLIAALLGDGITSRSLKCAFIWFIVVIAGALLAHVTGRALHLREGERR
jgi:multicomponent Na+:H+ antiporter subunit G